MDHWLRGTRSGRGPAFTYYRDWVKYAGHGADDEQYGVSARFPVRGRSTTFTLSGSDALAAPGGAAAPGSVTFVNPSGGSPAAYSETSNFTGPDASPSSGDVPPQEVAGQFAAFTSAPFAKAFKVVGIPSAHLRISNSNGQDMVFFAKVYDVDRRRQRHADPSSDRSGAGAGGRGRTAGRTSSSPASPTASPRVTGSGWCCARTDQTSYNAKVADVLTVLTGPGSTFTLPGKVR